MSTRGKVAHSGVAIIIIMLVAIWLHLLPERISGLTIVVAAFAVLFAIPSQPQTR